MTPVPTTMEELNKLSIWTVWIMNKSDRFKDCPEEIKREVEQIVESCRDSL